MTHFQWIRCCFIAFALSAQTGWAESLWILIDTHAAELRLMQGTRVVKQYEGIAIGRRGAEPLHYQGDDATPIGTYRIDGINDESRYDIFLRLNYPTPAHARLALAAGKISDVDARRIEAAESAGRPPPWDTPLGGMIGIHGIGRGNLETHRRFNWTEGCVALDNRQIRDLAGRIGIGTRVEIR